MDQSIAREVGRISLSLGQSYAAAAGRERTLAANVAGLKNQLEDLRQRSIQYGIYLRDTTPIANSTIRCSSATRKSALQAASRETTSP